MPSVIACPSCQKQLKVPDELIGRNVKCPGCKETFTAQVLSQSAPAAPPPMPQEEIAEKPRKRPAPPPEEEEEDEAPPRAVRRRDDDDDDEGDARPSRRRRRGGARMEPHRGVLILLLGIGSLVVFGPLGPFAWILGNKDLKEMDAGRMDPEGRSQTQIGKICGMIASILMVVSFVGFCLMFLLCGLGGIVGGNHP